MGIVLPLLVAVAIILGSYYILTTLYRKRREGEPSVVKGHVLWGSGEDFSSHAVNFLHKCQKAYGKIFTIRLLNQYLTIVADPHSYEQFCKEKTFDFDPIQKQVNFNVFGFVLKDAKQQVKKAGKTVRGAALDKNLNGFCNNLEEAITNVIPRADNNNPSKEWTEVGLRALTCQTIFSAIFYSIFGRSSKSETFDSVLYCQQFEIFHRYFNYLWLGLPLKLFPEATKALEKLIKVPSSEALANGDASEYIKVAIDFMRDRGQTETDIIGHNLVYLHVNYNTFKVAFWMLNNILENKDAHAALLTELDEMVEQKQQETGEDEVQLDIADVEGMKVLDSVVKESFRLASGVFMVRYVTDDTQFKLDDGSEHLVRKGDRIAVYPPAIHKDPEIYKEPLVFKYDRFVDATFYKGGQEVKHPLLSFGSLCPGKRLALMEAKIFILSMLNNFDMKLLEGEKAEYDNKYHGHEILPPVSDVKIHYREKSSKHSLRFF